MIWEIWNCSVRTFMPCIPSNISGWNLISMFLPVRCLDKWLSWEEVKFYAAAFDLPTVPELQFQTVEELSQEQLRQQVLALARQPGVFGTKDPLTGEDCTREGIVTRNIGEYPVGEFAHNVFKCVRKGPCEDR